MGSAAGPTRIKNRRFLLFRARTRLQSGLLQSGVADDAAARCGSPSNEALLLMFLEVTILSEAWLISYRVDKLQPEVRGRKTQARLFKNG